jgi:hypothetical protein
MQLVSLDGFSKQVADELIELDLRIRPAVSALRMWERTFTESEQTRLGGSFEDAFRQRGTLRMWMDAYGVSPIRAVIDASLAIGFATAEKHRWLLRETGEAGGEASLKAAIESGALVLTEEREAYFLGEEIDTDWRTHEKSWNFLWELSRRSKRGQWLEYSHLGKAAKPRTLADRKNHLKKLVPKALFELIKREGAHGCQINLSPEKIRLFELATQEELREWNGWEPASDL